MSSIGFEATEFPEINDINIIKLENEKYTLLDEHSYEKYVGLMNELCDAE